MAECKTIRARLLVALLALTLFAVACGDDTTETATAEPEPADTAEPEEEAEPEPVEDPEAESDPVEEPEPEPVEEPEPAEEIDLRIPASLSVVQPIDQVEPRPAVEPEYPIGDRVCPSGVEPRQELETLVEVGVFDAPAEVIEADGATYISAPIVVAQRYESDPAEFLALFGDGRCEIGAWTVDNEFEAFLTSVDVPLELDGPSDRDWLAVTVEPSAADDPSGHFAGLLLIAGSDSVALFAIPESTQLATPEQLRARIAGLFQEILDLY